MRTLEAINDDYKNQCAILGDLHVKLDALNAGVKAVMQKISVLQAEGQEFLKMQEELKKAQVKETMTAPVPAEPNV